MNVIGSKVVQVLFKSGVVVFMKVDIYEHKTFEGSLSFISDDIVGYIDNGIFIDIK